jgi:mannose-6-phosphate isomerase-like protein (cupin superfamily)
MVTSLGLQLHDLFTSIEQSQASVIRKGEGRKYYTEGDASTEYLAMNITNKKMEPIKILAPSEYSTGADPISHYGEQFLFVLEGKIEIAAGEQTHKLSAGDSVYLAAGTPYSWHNAGKETAEIISVVTPPQI